MPEWYWFGTIEVGLGAAAFGLWYAVGRSNREAARVMLGVPVAALLWPLTLTLAVLAGLGLLVRAAELPTPRLPRRRPRGEVLAERIRELEEEAGIGPEACENGPTAPARGQVAPGAADGPRGRENRTSQALRPTPPRGSAGIGDARRWRR